MSTTDQKFEVGQTVSWTSQGGGTSTVKTGTIFKVVPAGKTPADSRMPVAVSFPDHQLMFDGARSTVRSDGDSYLVEVRPEKGNAKSRLYWPRTNALRPEGQP